MPKSRSPVPPSMQPAPSQPSRERRLTAILGIWNEDHRAALDQAMPQVVADLHRVASRLLAGEPANHTLQPTALVNELYLRLCDRRSGSWTDRAHFFAFAARTMRRILVDHARARRAEKRGAGWKWTDLCGAECLAAPQSRLDVTELDEALEALERFDRSLCRLVELRFFIGLTLRETAAVLGVSVPTVSREWALARAWLARELGPADLR